MPKSERFVVCYAKDSDLVRRVLTVRVLEVETGWSVCGENLVFVQLSSSFIIGRVHKP